MSAAGSRRLLVVGASSGIGRATVEIAAERGWRVAAAARRAHLLDGLADETGAVPITADVTEEAQCRDLVGQAVEVLGGLDALVYAAGTVPLQPLADAGPELWRRVLDTNLVGAALVTRACLPHLIAGGRVVYLSSDSVGRPFPGLVPYAASKAGLEEMVRGWRAEHPDVGFTVAVVGPTLTGMADGWDPDAAAGAFARWKADGYLAEQPDPLPASAVAETVLGALALDPPAETIRVVRPAAGDHP